MFSIYPCTIQMLQHIKIMRIMLVRNSPNMYMQMILYVVCIIYTNK